eukprot:SAG22_NODE_17307_length_307_cov_0.961538_1_plen_54_part_01
MAELPVEAVVADWRRALPAVPAGGRLATTAAAPAPRSAGDGVGSDSGSSHSSNG